MDAAGREDVWKRKHDGKRERDRLLLALFAYAGLRRSELLGLDWQDVDLERRLLKIRRAKGGRQRIVPIHPALEPLFVDYLRVRAGDPEPSLFVGVQGEAALADDPDADVPSLRACRRRDGAEARDAAHASARLCVRAPAGWREPPPDPGAARP